MARNLIKTSGSVFMGNPITYKVTAETEPSDVVVSFHRVKLRVTIEGRTYELSTPARSGEDVEFDVSSCFRAAADTYEYTPLTEGRRAFPVFVADIEARDVWLREGVLIDPAPVGGGRPTAQCTAYMGAFSDFERRHATQTVTGTRKPLSPEIAFAGDPIVYTGDRMSFVRVMQDTELGTTVTLPNGCHVYVDEPRLGSCLFQMVNSRGLIESVRAFQLRTEKVSGSTEEHTISRLERFDTFSRVYAKRTADRESLSLSSGFVSYEWARWWAYEFCVSPHHWMLFDGIWTPCIVERDDSLTVVDETKPGMCYVAFTCKPDQNGALW